MAKKRYFVAQYCDGRAGWTDISGGSFLSQKPADNFAEGFAKSKMVATRVQRKPHGWEPPPISNDLQIIGEGSVHGEANLSDEMRESRKNKRK